MLKAKIHYELDFQLGADVEIGCGSTVSADGTKDQKLSRDDWTNPLSMVAVALHGSFFPTEIYTRGCHWIPRMFA
jgi:hypothetical protein